MPPKPVLLAAILACLAACNSSLAQSPSTPHTSTTLSQVWSPDLGNGTYKNPVLYADYSDPDVIRVGADFYLVASSFNNVPALPILHSRDLVNWQIVAHVFTQQQPTDRYRLPQRGMGVWAPSIRFHNGTFFIFYPDPDIGIYMTQAKTVTGPWSAPLLIKAAPGWIDPCPFWDQDGKAYLVNASAGSRRGIKGILMVSRMATDGTHLLGDASILVDGHAQDPTLEGPKIYKRHGWYYLFAPAGGVTQGWQVVFRSRSIYGPYERKVVLAQGHTAINGPHQGAWVDTGLGEDWFLHFQDQGAYGRVVHLEPMRWQDDWPVIGSHPRSEAPGNHTSSDTVGEPVLTFRKPRVLHPSGAVNPLDSDEFNATEIGPQWQWQANPQPDWAFPSAARGVLRLTNIAPESAPESAQQSTHPNLWNVPNILTQKLPGPAFTATTRVTFTSRAVGEETGLIVLGASYAYLGVLHTADGLVVRMVQRHDAEHAGPSTESAATALSGTTVYLRATVEPGGLVRFGFSEDDRNYRPVGTTFTAAPGRWVGATLGIFALGTSAPGERGYADFDWFRLQALAADR